jgi:protein-L-isoaspartate(D-aspartate) O-methyltransferase
MKIISRIALVSLMDLLAAGCGLSDDVLVRERRNMVADQIEARGVHDPRVVEAMRAVPRHDFVDGLSALDAYGDHPLPIGHGQTISQPYIVALMTELLGLKSGGRVLEIGTGSGYQAAILATITPDVYTIEIVPELHRKALQRLATYGLDESRVILGDGYQGLPAKAPFDAIIVTAAPEVVPEPLFEQLRPGGKMVIPVGPAGGIQRLLVVEKSAYGFRHEREVIPVQFVPFTGEAEKQARELRR